MRAAIARDPDRLAYMDQALTPVGDDDEALDLLTKTSGAKAAVAHVRRIAELTGGATKRKAYRSAGSIG